MKNENITQIIVIRYECMLGVGNDTICDSGGGGAELLRITPAMTMNFQMFWLRNNFNIKDFTSIQPASGDFKKTIT